MVPSILGFLTRSDDYAFFYAFASRTRRVELQ
ncbi:hypothetical protein CEXT_600141, partial [Caerostris extrusa]